MKPRIALITPLPPHTSGIADYSADLLPSLLEKAVVDIYWLGDGYTPACCDGVELRHHSELTGRIGDYDGVIVNVAQGVDFDPAVRIAERCQCVVVLHDLNLSGIYGEKYIASRRFAAYFLELLRQEGLSAYARSVWKFIAHRRCPDMTDYTMTKRVASAKLLVVHSDAARKAFIHKHPRACVGVVPHGASERPLTTYDDTAAARRNLGLNEHAFILGAFGTVDKRKRIHIALKALSELVAGNPDMQMCLVGHANDEWQALVDSMGLSRNVVITGRVDISRFYDYMSAIDVCVNLRNPWLGESSGPALRVMSCGKPIIVSDTGEFADFDDDACLKVATDDQEQCDLTSAMKWAVANPDELAAIGRRGRDYVSESHSWSVAADGLIQAALKARMPKDNLL